MNDISWHKSGQDLIDEIAAEQVPERTVCIWSVGQCGFIVKTAATVIGIDLVFSPLYTSDGLLKSLFLPPFKSDAGLQLSWLLASHNHIDHLDIPTIEGLLETNRNLQVLIPGAVRFEVPLNDNRIRYIKQNEPVHIPDGSITGIATAHDKYRYDSNGNSYSLGYVISQPGITMFHSGDALSDLELFNAVAAFHPDIVFLPINGRDAVREKQGIIGNMTMKEAVHMAKQLSPKFFIPMHHDMFSNNGFDVETCKTYAEQQIPEVKTLVPHLGEKMVLEL